MAGQQINLFGFSWDLKWISLFLLIVQNTTLVICLRYSRVHPANGEPYLTSTAVCLAEVMKLAISSYMVYLERKEHDDFLVFLKSEIYNRDTIKLSIPGFLYLVQNNLLFTAISNLDTAVYQVTYQLKILTTAFFSVSMLGHKLRSYQYIALGLLAFGVALVQIAQSSSSEAAEANGNAIWGVSCVLMACITSGFVGVYTEKILKHGRPVSLFMRNIQLGLFGAVLGFGSVFTQDFGKIMDHGFLQGYNSLVWFIILTQAGGGLMIAAVIKYADNILKGFATSISIILSAIISSMFFGLTMSVLFLFGVMLVIAAVFLYGYVPKAKSQDGQV